MLKPYAHQIKTNKKSNQNQFAREMFNIQKLPNHIAKFNANR